MKNLAPIVLFVYNRPQHTLRTLLSLASNAEAKESVLYIYCDGAKEGATDEQHEKIKQVRKIVNAENRFKEVIVIEQEKNKGLASSIIEGVTAIVNKFEKIIVVEDDIVTSSYFLKFMNDALRIYSSDTDVACISGYIYPVKHELPETFFIKVAECWGWATWKRAWDIFENDGSKLLEEIERNDLSFAFDFDNSYSFTQMLREQIEGKNSSWAIRWYASAFLKNKYCLYPGVSMAMNIGIDGSGTHSGISDKWTVQLSQVKINIDKITIEENVEAKKSIINYFQIIKKSNRSLSQRAIGIVKAIFKKNVWK